MNVTSKCAELFKAMSHPTRIGIIQALNSGERCVCEIQPLLRVTQPTLSKHLSVLRQAGLVLCQSDGPRLICRLASDRVPELLHIAASLVEERVRNESELLSEFVGKMECPGGRGQQS